MSHLKALKEFYENTDDEYCIIAEDDVNLDIAHYWNFKWTEFFSLLPYDWDCVQMTVISTGDIHVKLHLKFINDFSAAFYLITRHHAGKVLKNHVRGKKWKLDNGVKPRAVADDLIYNSGNTYAIPVFMYKIELGSSIHGDHIDTFHKSSYEGLWNFWRETSPQIDDWNKLLDFDPYFGTLPPGVYSK